MIPAALLGTGLAVASSHPPRTRAWGSHATGCKKLYSIIRAQEFGCNIITIPDAIIDRIHMLNKD